MELLSIYVKPSEVYASKLCDRIRAEIGRLHNISSGVRTNWKLFDRYAKVTIKADLQRFEPIQMSSKTFEAISAAVTEHIFAEEESSILKEIIHKEYHYRETDDVHAIEQYCTQYLGGSGEAGHVAEHSLSRRTTKIRAQLSGFILENKHLNLGGFIRFRLHDYWEEMREVAEFAVDEFMLERQYKEFISLLKYFVYVQEAKIPVVHLIHKGGHEFTILNELLQPVDLSKVDSAVTLGLLEKDINFEDMIVSTLITVSPANIYIHTREPELPVIKTIGQIFENRTEVCSQCRVCHVYFEELPMTF
jgi:putative sporulation protein YtxC